MNWIDRKVEDYGLSSAYDQYIMADWRTCLWNPTRYLNIWLTKISTRSSEFPFFPYVFIAINLDSQPVDEPTRPME